MHARGDGCGQFTPSVEGTGLKPLKDGNKKKRTRPIPKSKIDVLVATGEIL